MMEQEEITRRNVAIAEYMYPNLVYDDHVGACHEYHCSWEWLMPTVEKIMEESRLAFHAFPKGSGNKSVCRFGMLLKNEAGDTMIEATWKAVSEYVLALK